MTRPAPFPRLTFDPSAVTEPPTRHPADTWAAPCGTTTATIHGNTGPHHLHVHWALTGGRIDPVSIGWNHAGAPVTTRPPTPPGQIITAMRALITTAWEASLPTLAQLDPHHAHHLSRALPRSRTRRAGPGRPPGPPADRAALLHAVAKVYRHALAQAHAHGHPPRPAKAVRDHYRGQYAPRTTAALISEARTAGILTEPPPPGGRPHRYPEPGCHREAASPGQCYPGPERQTVPVTDRLTHQFAQTPSSQPGPVSSPSPHPSRLHGCP